MALPTHHELLALVSQRHPTLDTDKHTEIASVALAVMSEPHWVRRGGIPPLVAVKIAAHRALRSSIVALPK